MSGMDFSRLLDEHKCKGCVWGKWTEVKYVCLFPGCLRSLWRSDRIKREDEE